MDITVNDIEFTEGQKYLVDNNTEFGPMDFEDEALIKFTGFDSGVRFGKVEMHFVIPESSEEFSIDKEELRKAVKHNVIRLAIEA